MKKDHMAVVVKKRKRKKEKIRKGSRSKSNC